MWLDELEQMVRTLADRIRQHGHTLRGNELATRYALIDPLLVSLGWNLADPSEVVAEYRLGDGGDRRVDYAMLYDGRPYLLVEAKNLGERLLKAAEQAGQYALTTSAQFVVLTNGQHWEGYSLGGRDKRVFEFDVARSDSVALDLLWLWRGNFKGRTVEPKLRTPSGEAAVSTSTATAPTSPKHTASGEPLPAVTYAKTMNKPRRLVFPDGTLKDVSRSWASVQPATAEWLIDNNHVHAKNLPLCNKGGTHLLHSSPTRRDGIAFKSHREVRKGYYIDTNFAPANQLRKAKELLESCGVDPNTVRLEFD